MPTSDTDIIYTRSTSHGQGGYTNFSGLSLPEYNEHSATFLKPLFKIGDSTNKAKIGTTAIPLWQIYATSALTSGTQDVVKIDFTQTAAQQSGYIKGLRCTMTSNVKTPGSFNAVKGIIDYSTNGYPWGDCAPLASELVPPNSSAPRGEMAAIELQIVPGASSSWASAGPMSFIRCQIGANKTNYDAIGYFVDFKGFSEGSNLLIDSDGDPAATGGIRCHCDGGDIWLLYRDTAPA